jgi:hypothetical protein
MPTSNEQRLAPVDRSYLRPRQHEQLAGEKKRIEDTLKMDRAITRGLDRVEAGRRLHQVDAMLQREGAPVLEGPTKDKAVRREAELKDRIREGMLSKEEMRTNPDGAVDRHVRWEAAKADDIQEWKNLRVALNPGNEDQDLCNIETFRPDRNVGTMYNQEISRVDYHMPPGNIEIRNVAEPGYFTEKQKETLARLEAMDAAGQIPDDQRELLGLAPKQTTYEATRTKPVRRRDRNDDDEKPEQTEPVKRGPGRPRKNPE